MPDAGKIFLPLAFVVALYIAGIGLSGALRRQKDFLDSAGNGIIAGAILTTLAWASLLYAFVTNDFSLSYVAQYSSRDTELLYRLSGSYAGQEGSLLMWGWSLSVFQLIVQLQNRSRSQALMPWVNVIMASSQVFFLGLLAFIADPFERLPYVPSDGHGLNPLLQNMGCSSIPPPSTWATWAPRSPSPSLWLH